jgi:gliding motility-associated-like protein
LKRLLPVLLLSSCLNFVFAQNDNVGPGRALKFDGVDDLVELGDIYDNIALPVTISAWIYIDPVAGVFTYPIFDSQDNSPVYNGFTMIVSTLPHIGITYGDGEGGNNPAYRRSKAALFPFLTGRWAHITGVLRGADDMDIYLNGQNMGGGYQGSSNKPMNSNSPAEIAKIGYLFSNGITSHFKGLMDEVRIWNKALTEAEIRTDMCRKLTGNEAGLIGYWTFDETSGNIVKDKSTNHFDGVLVGNPQRVYSGAPIGDESAFLYTSTWLGRSITLGDLKAEAITNDPDGIQLYKVNSIPSQTGGLNGNERAPYYGVFVANQQNGNEFTLQYNGNFLCKLLRRDDNSNPVWTELDHASNLPDRIELIPVETVPIFTVDLGQDKTLCDQSSLQLTPVLADATGKSFLWSTGETSASITVTSTGKFAVAVSQSCGSVTDTISVSFLHTPPTFSLGADEVSCGFTPRTLDPVQTTDFEFTWQDGSHTKSYVATDFGVYWLTLKNVCGSFTDSVRFSQIPFDNNFDADLGPDKVLCDQALATLKPGLDSAPGRSFLWSTGETSSSITVTHAGKYAVQVWQHCQTAQDTIAVSVLQTPSAFSLGTDEVLCKLSPRILEPIPSASEDLEFTWQDGSHAKHYEVKDFGTYRLKVENLCGSTADSITFSRLELDKQKIPNVITPNGDGLNQYFILDPLLLGSRLLIFNRWGQTIYHSPSYQNEWDGSNVAPGTYFYTLTGACVDDLKGPIHVLK